MTTVSTLGNKRSSPPPRPGASPLKRAFGLALSLLVAAEVLAAVPAFTPINVTIAEDTDSGVLSLAIVDPDVGDTHTVTLGAQPTGGTVTLIGNDVLVVPDWNFHGTLMFDLTVCDQGASCLTQTNTAQVTPVNDPPLTGPISFTTAYETASAPQHPAVNDPDPGDVHSVEIVTPSPDGVAAVATGPSLVFTPAAGFSGTTYFQFRVCDALECSLPALATVTVSPPVGPPPTLAGASLTTEVGTTSEWVALALTGDDPMQTYTLELLAPPPPGGSVELDFPNVRYTPPSGFVGPTAFEVRACDLLDVCSNPAVVSVVVANAAGVPSLAPLTITTDEDTPSAWLTVVVNDPTPGDTHTLFQTGTSDHGILEISGLSVRFVPFPDYHGTTSVELKACDASDQCSLPVTVPVTVIPLPDPPVLTGGVELLAWQDYPSAWFSVPAASPDGETELSLTVSTPPATGTVEIDPVDPLVIRYVPDPGSTSDDSFEFLLCDSRALCSGPYTGEVTVDARNYPPVAAELLIETDEDAPSPWLTPSYTDDNPGDTHVSQIREQSADGVAEVSGVDIRFVPAADFSGSTTFLFRVCDSSGGCSPNTLATVVVNPVPDAPTAESLLIVTQRDVTSEFVAPVVSDPDPLDTHTFEVTLQGAGGVAEASELGIRFIPDPGFEGSTHFEFRVCDDGGLCSDSLIAVVMVTRANVTPTVGPIALALDEDTTTGLIAPSIIDPDAGETHTLSLVSAPLNGTLTFTGTDFEYAPHADWFGVDAAVLQVCDALMACSTFDVSFNVAPVNDPPVLEPLSITTNEDVPSAPQLLAVTDVDSAAPPSFSITQGAGGVATIASGELVFTPESNFSGATSFTIEVCDDLMACTQLTVPVLVALVNDPPSVAAFSIATDEDTNSGPHAVAFTDPDGLDTHTLVISQTPANGAAQVEASGTEVSYQPAPDFNGPDSFFVEVCDQHNACSEAEVTVTVNPVNDPPTSFSLSLLTKQDTPSEWFAVTVLDPDEGDLHAIRILAQPAMAQIDVNPTLEQARAMPNPGASGIESFAIEVCDLAGACLTGEASLEIIRAMALLTGAPAVKIPMVATPVLSMTSGQAVESDSILLTDGSSGVVSGEHGVEVELSADAPYAYVVRGVTLNPGARVSLGTVDFSASGGRLSLPMALSTLAGVTPGYGGSIRFIVDDPYAADLTAPITVWDPSEAIRVQADKTSYARLVEPASVAASTLGAACNGGVFVYDVASRFEGYPRTRSYCAVRWEALPSALSQSQQRTDPFASGYFQSPAASETVGYQVGLASWDAAGNLFFAPVASTQTIAIALSDPTPPVLTFRPSTLLSALQQFVAEGEWPSRVGTGVTVGSVRAAADYPGLILQVASPSAGPQEIRSAHAVASADIQTSLANLWQRESVVVRAQYEQAPSLFAETSLTFTAAPLAPSLRVTRPELVNNLEPVTVEGTLSAFDPQAGALTYDPQAHGEWVLRLYRVNPDRSRELLSGDHTPATPDGSFAITGEVLSAGTQRLVVVAELLEGGVATGDTLTSATLIVSVKDATPIEITLSAARDYGVLPFNAILRAKLANSRRSGDAAEVSWEYSDDGGASWTRVERDPRYLRAFAYADLRDAPGARAYRATTINRYSGERFESNVVEVTAFRVPVFSLSGYSDTFVGYPVDWTVATTETLPVQYSWTIRRGYSDPSPESMAGTANTLAADTAGTWYVEVRARYLSSPDVPQAWRQVRKTLAVKSPSIRRAVIDGPRLLEVGKTYTYTAKTDHCLDPRLQTHLTLNGRWVMPDGSTQVGDSVAYTPAEGDTKAIRYEAWVDGYLDETKQTTTRTLTFWSYAWPEWYVFSKVLFPYTPARITYQIKPKIGGSLGSEPIAFDWTIPPGAVVERHDGSQVTLRFEAAGTWTVDASVADTRGNAQVIATTHEVTPPPPLGASLTVTVGDSWSRAPADLIARWAVSGLVPGERIEAVSLRVNGAVVSNSTYTTVRSRVASPGTYTVEIELQSNAGRTASASKVVDLILGDPPVCNITARGDGVRSLEALAGCSTTMGILTGFHWWITYADTGETQDLGLRGARILMSSTALARGVASITLVGVNDKGQESTPDFWYAP